MNKIPYLVLIEDDVPTSVYNEIIITESGYVRKYKNFCSTLDALDAFKDRFPIPDFILLDINMPRMDGWGFLEEFKALLERKHNTPFPQIYMLSTSLSSHDLIRGEQNPLVQGFFQKPLTEEILLELTQMHHEKICSFTR
ncbi:MAG: response regulator [Bacteroidota bacterium]